MAGWLAGQVLLNCGANVRAVDGAGRSALWHGLHLDKVETLRCAKLLLDSGAAPVTGPTGKAEDGTWGCPCRDITGETWVHRAVRCGGGGWERGGGRA